MQCYEYPTVWQEDALEELENNAIQFTQAQAQTQAPRYQPPPSSDYGDEFDDEDLDDAIVVDESRSTPALTHYPHRSIPGQASQREHLRPFPHGNTNHILANRQCPIPPTDSNQPLPSHPVRSHTQSRAAVPEDDSLRVEQGSAAQTEANSEVERLKRMVEELRKETNSLKNEVNAKAGEISIVRSKHETTVKEYEREIAAQRKLGEEKLAKQQKALEAARIAEKNAATERDFIKRDLAEETERVRKLNKAREVERKVSDLTTTPKKKKALPHRDGFDDDEMDILSPSRISPSKFQKRNTPSKPGKRKRKTVESPAGALHVIHPEESSSTDPGQQAPVLDEALIARLAVQDERFDFLGIMLDHRIDGKNLRTFEELGKHAYPSAPSESFQSIILCKVPSLGFKKLSKDLEIDFCELLISMWTRCMDEEYYEPMYLFMAMLTSALELNTSSIAPFIIDTLLPITQRTADRVAIPRFNRTAYDDRIDCTTCMSLMYLAAQGCMSSQEHILRFWKLMRWDLVLFMLSPNQGPTDVELMLDLLSTSIMKDSFGAFPGDETMHNQPGYIIDRISFCFTEIPRKVVLATKWEAPNKPIIGEKWAASDISHLQIRSLLLLIGMTRSPYASNALAAHQHLLGKLVSLISDEMDSLYDYQSGREDSARIVTLATRLLYYIVTKYENLDLQKKLSTIPGGCQKYLLCLSRLNFSEDDLVLESGIEPDVAGLAFELLGLRVTLEEGDAIHDAFSSS
ncbi:DNA repair protein Rad26 [Drepanopeziza brunnea f. sp. 'multigermtubi' MB_m1]|uniref:DNA repair protein Rad26 n=1 Tax=Marssonina brunnea f. sp. multigermtubi (strain MB_m1) TaxID=1072389 RepID=K1WZ67_MARBU|nr:DNA repair protein Rad26 [Drepanopeziza brunnea f. sp. 'multigermtubi' MB_m1]EKD18276.1 DNA repair protein Rad26 [Drepanopeziza brunnea f. sp. 'multigermtubi' MB_m1]